MGTPLWVDLLSPVATLVGIVVAFLLGRIQGRSQTRYVESARVLTELRRIVLEIQMYAVVSPGMTEEERNILAEKVVEHQAELVRYWETHALWLPRTARDRVDTVLKDFARLTNYENVRNNKSENIDAEEHEAQLHSFVAELSVEKELLLGTGPPWWKPWLLTRSGRRKRFEGYSWEG